MHIRQDLATEARSRAAADEAQANNAHASLQLDSIHWAAVQVFRWW